MELDEYIAEGTVSFWPPISQEAWDAASESSRDQVLALLPADETDLAEVYNGQPMFFPKYDQNGLRAFTYYDRGTPVAITAHLATFIAEWTDASKGRSLIIVSRDIRTFSGCIIGTNLGGEPNAWSISGSRVLDLRLEEPSGLLALLEVSGKNLIDWLVYQDETSPYHVYDLPESIAALVREMALLCPGLDGALTFDATLKATYKGMTDEEHEAISDHIAGDVKAQGAWAIAIVAKTVGLAEVWIAHLADRAKERRVTGNIAEFAVQAKVITAPHRNEWDDDAADGDDE